MSTVTLTALQVRKLAYDYVEQMSQDEFINLFKERLDHNFHTEVHTDTLDKMAKLVGKKCNLKIKVILE